VRTMSSEGSIEVVPSLHSALNTKHYFNAGIGSRDIVPPLRLRDYVEGGTLAYLVRLGGHQVLVFGSMNYIEREVDGLRPGVVLIAAARPRLEIHDYTGRLLRALGQPRVVIATHWDNQGLPFGTPQDEALEQTASFVAEVKAVVPRGQVVVRRSSSKVRLTIYSSRCGMRPCWLPGRRLSLHAFAAFHLKSCTSSLPNAIVLLHQAAQPVLQGSDSERPRRTATKSNRCLV
jgi:hypothetical protein